MEVFFMATALSQFRNCTVLSDVNGCSVPLGIDVPFKDAFTPACLNHDVCYRCGKTYGWSQLECDDGFKRLMYKICSEKYDQNDEEFARKKRFLGWLKKKYEKIKELKAKIQRGWLEARKNASSKEELNRMAKAAGSLIKMVSKFVFAKDGKNKCLLAADIFHKSVEGFGMYKYRYENKPYCKESCAAKLGNPFIEN